MSSRMAEKLAPDRQTSTWPTIPRANNARAESNSGFFVLSINVPPLWVNAIALTASSETYGLDPNALAGAHDVVSRGFKRAHGASPNSRLNNTNDRGGPVDVAGYVVRGRNRLFPVEIGGGQQTWCGLAKECDVSGDGGCSQRQPFPLTSRRRAGGRVPTVGLTH
jgi:hypothetical protein